jgi:hypothetical protein
VSDGGALSLQGGLLGSSHGGQLQEDGIDGVHGALADSASATISFWHLRYECWRPLVSLDHSFNQP